MALQPEQQPVASTPRGHEAAIIAETRGYIEAVATAKCVMDRPYGPGSATGQAWVRGFVRACVEPGQLQFIKRQSPRGHAHWHPAERDFLTLAWSTSLPKLIIAELLGRSGRSVRIQATRLRLTKRSTRGLRAGQRKSRVAA